MKKSKSSYVNLTVNPCKMCMPMGVCNALYGIKKLHDNIAWFTRLQYIH